MKDLAEKIARITGSTNSIIHQKSEDDDYLVDNPERRCPDTSKIKKELGWRAKVPLEEGLRKTIEWHKRMSALKAT